MVIKKIKIDCDFLVLKTIKMLSFVKKVDKNKKGKSFSPDCSGIVFWDDRNGKQELPLLIIPEPFASNYKFNFLIIYPDYNQYMAFRFL